MAAEQRRARTHVFLQRKAARTLVFLKEMNVEHFLFFTKQNDLTIISIAKQKDTGCLGSTEISQGLGPKVPALKPLSLLLLDLTPLVTINPVLTSDRAYL